MANTLAVLTPLLVLGVASAVSAQSKPIPRTQAVPEPYDQVSFQHDSKELARLHLAPSLRRPFVYPVVGPSGKPLTRMGHPHDPNGHSHHNSVWISHHDVNGVDFWGDRGKGRIVHQRIDKLTDGDTASALTVNYWIDEEKKQPFLLERRKVTVQPLEKGEWLLLLDLQLEAKTDVTFGKTPFGLIGVRMAKTIGVRDGGGTIRNSEGQVNEKEIFWKPARWVDYSGPITDKAVEGITLFDHPANPNHPSIFHVREDGWMGASLSFAGAMPLANGKALRLRYGLYIHAGMPERESIHARWQVFTKTPMDDLTPKRK